MTDAYAPAFALIARGQAQAGADQVCQLAAQAVLAGRLDEAERALTRAQAAVPMHGGVLARLAGLAQLRGDIPRAQDLAAQALRHDPGDVMAATMRGDHLSAKGQPALAIATIEAALAKQPRAPHLHRALGLALLQIGRSTDAYRRARAAADALGDNVSAISLAAMCALYDETLSAAQLDEVQRTLAARIAPDPVASAPLVPRQRASGDRIRVGFVSADFVTHPVGWFVEPLFRHLPREEFTCFAYARVAEPDAQTQRLRGAVESWRDASAWTDTQTHAAIVADRLDVLIDLSGFTAGARPRLFAGRAAPLQVGWLGYPHATGLAGIDAVLGDAIVLPDDAGATPRERVLRLPHAFMGMLPPDDAPPVAPLPSLFGRPFTFGSFNTLAKLSDKTVALWAQVLHAVPGSRLALSATTLGEDATRDFTRHRFVRHGIDGARIVTLPPKPRLSEFLAHYGEIDLALDPLPFNGGTTTIHALWQGAPTLTLPGASMMNRMGLSIADTAGLRDAVVARDAAHYVALALDWSQRRDALAQLRAGLRDRVRRTSLFDGAKFAQGFAATLRHALG